MSYYVYVLGSAKKPKKTYVGWTKNLKERLKKHNSGVGAKSTRGRRWRIVYFETVNGKSKALKREYVLKKDRKLRKSLRSKI